MTLADHAAAGAAAALVFKKNPLLAFIAAFLSHFVLDAIPHWHYQLKSFDKKDINGFSGKFIFDKRFIFDLRNITADFFLGALPSLVAAKIFQGNYLLVVYLGIIGGVLPDALQFFYHLFPDSFLRHLQKFHLFIHHSENLDNKPLLGVSLQLILGVICLAAIAII